jgi:hypothetical protein
MGDILSNSQGQPVPELTNVAVSYWATGGWIADQVAPVKTVSKDVFRFGRWSDQVNKYNVNAARARGDVGNVIEAPGRTWFDGIISESQLRAYYTDEEVKDSPNPDDPRISRVNTITNALRYAVEVKVAAAMDPASLPAAQKTAASANYENAAATPEKDWIEAVANFEILNGIAPNFCLFGDLKSWTAWVTNKQIRESRGLYVNQLMNGMPDSYMGLPILKPSARYDSAPASTTFTPSRVWAYNAMLFGYSPGLASGTWDGNSPVFAGQFQSALTGSNPFEASEYLDPHYTSNHVRWIVMNFRRDLELIDPLKLYAVTGVHA